MQKDTVQSVPSAQNVAPQNVPPTAGDASQEAENAAYDAFVEKLDFSSGKFKTHVRRKGDVRDDHQRIACGECWEWSAKLFARDVIEKYGPGLYVVRIFGPLPATGVHSRLCSMRVEG